MLPGSNAGSWQHASYCLLKSTKKGSVQDGELEPVASRGQSEVQQLFYFWVRSVGNNGRLIKVPVFIDHYDDTIQNLYGSKNGDKRKYYELSYEEARREYYRF